MKEIERIAIIGFGEVGGIFGGDFAQNGLKVAVTDILLRDGQLFGGHDAKRRGGREFPRTSSTKMRLPGRMW